MNDSFDVIPGDPGSHVIIHVPHSSRAIPADVRAGIVLDDLALERELDAMTDSFTDVIATQVADRAGERPWLFMNRLSRLVVDPERFPDEHEEMNAVGMGVVYTRTSTGEVLREESADKISGLVDRFFTPHSQAFTNLVDQRLAATGQATIIDLHSYPLTPNPYELHDGPRPEICLGTDTFHTPPDLQAAALHSFSDFEPGLDSPFAGCYVPLTHYGVNRSVSALMIELRRDLYMDDNFSLVEPALEPIVATLADLVDHVSAGMLATQAEGCR